MRLRRTIDSACTKPLPAAVAASQPSPRRSPESAGCRGGSEPCWHDRAGGKVQPDISLGQSEFARLRPDLVVPDHCAKTCTIVDVIIPAENGPKCYKQARQSKISKYDGLTSDLVQNGWSRTDKNQERFPK